MTRDPRSEAEKARADLKRNSEMGIAPSETPLTDRPSVTPDTFGEHGARARALSGTDQGIEAGGARPGTDTDPRTGGFGVADSTMGTEGSESLAEAEQVLTGRTTTAPATRPDVMNRGRE